MLRTSRWAVAVWASLVAVAACSKPQPSAEYTEASGTYTTLLAKYGDDAFSDPEMARIEELLGRVPPKSSDAAAATELKARIASERKRVEQETREREKTMASALAPQPPGDFAKSPPDEPQPPPAAEAGDAGPSSDLKPGMTLEDLRAVSEGCFSSSGPITLRKPDRTEVQGEMFERLDSTLCRAKYAAYEGRFLVFKEGKLAGNFDKASLTTIAKPPPAPQPAAPADAGP